MAGAAPAPLCSAETGPDETGPDEIKPDETGPGEIGPGAIGPGETGPVISSPVGVAVTTPLSESGIRNVAGGGVWIV